MFVIDVSLKNSPITLSVQRKTEEDAKALYQQILEALRSGNPTTLEMTCEQMIGKTVAMLVSEVAAVQLSEKSSTATASGRPPGFFAVAAE
jgi:DNA-binding GntR family transcriptional regulator